MNRRNQHPPPRRGTPESVSSVGSLVRELRNLRQAADLSLKQVARDSSIRLPDGSLTPSIPVSTLSDAQSKRQKLPARRTVLGFVHGCGVTTALERDLWDQAWSRAKRDHSNSVGDNIEDFVYVNGEVGPPQPSEQVMGRPELTLQSCDQSHDKIFGTNFIEDELPELIDRGMFESALRPAVLFIDIDNLTVINKKFGDRLGDSVLLAVNDCIHRRQLGRVTYRGRCGDDTFYVVLKDGDRADEFARKMMGDVSRFPWSAYASALYVTCSVSYSIRHRSEDPYAWLTRAAEGLVQAKARGGNLIAHGPMVPARKYKSWTESRRRGLIEDQERRAAGVSRNGQSRQYKRRAASRGSAAAASIGQQIARVSKSQQEDVRRRQDQLTFIQEYRAPSLDEAKDTLRQRTQSGELDRLNHPIVNNVANEFLIVESPHDSFSLRNYFS